MTCPLCKTEMTDSVTFQPVTPQGDPPLPPPLPCTVCQQCFDNIVTKEWGGVISKEEE